MTTDLNPAARWLGCHVTDRITGFAGVCTGYVQYITGCNQLLVAPPAGEGISNDEGGRWFDESRLEIDEYEGRFGITKEGIVDYLDHEAPRTKGAGFDRPAPKR